MKVYKEKQYLIFDYEDGRTVKYDFATKTAIGIKGKPVKNLCSQLSGFTLNELIDCCDDEKYAKFLRFVRNSEMYSHSITNIGTILDRIPKYARFEQIFSAGFDDIIKDGKRFIYSINDIPKSLIKLCRKYPIKLSNNTVKYYKENQDAHYIAYNLDYISFDFNDIYSVWERRNNIVLTLDKQRCGFSYSYSVCTNGKKVQLKIETGKNDTIRSEASCNKNDKFDFNKGLELAKRRLIVKFLAKKVEDYAKSM